MGEKTCNEQSHRKSTEKAFCTEDANGKLLAKDQ